MLQLASRRLGEGAKRRDRKSYGDLLYKDRFNLAGMRSTELRIADSGAGYTHLTWRILGGYTQVGCVYMDVINHLKTIINEQNIIPFSNYYHYVV